MSYGLYEERFFMSHGDLENVGSAEEKLTEDGLENDQASRLVPVAESIRYRKRAQGAEKKAELLGEQLTEVTEKMDHISKELTEVRTEQTLLKKLSAAGAVDLDGALVLAKARFGDDGDSDIDVVVEQLREDKGYLFKQAASAVTAGKTSGARGRSGGCHSVIINAAQKAAASGSRRDLQEYLKLRRTIL